jgi:hypothetical protein
MERGKRGNVKCPGAPPRKPVRDDTIENDAGTIRIMNRIDYKLLAPFHIDYLLSPIATCRRE